MVLKLHKRIIYESPDRNLCQLESGRIIKTVSMEKKGPFWAKLPNLTHFYAQKVGKDMKIRVWKTKRGNDCAGQ